MALRRADPGEGGRRHVHFRYVATAPGAKPWVAWIAGPCYWCVCHTKGRSKPCLQWFTNGEITCERCASTSEPETIGYQPLYRDADGCPVMVIVHECSRELVDAFGFRERVYVSRGAAQSDPIAIQPVLGTKTWYTSTLKERQVPADLTDTLLLMWKEPLLTEWYRQTQTSSTKVPPPTARPVKSDGKPFDPMHAAAARRFEAPASEPVDVAEAIQTAGERMMRRVMDDPPSANGKHKPKG